MKNRGIRLAAERKKKAKIRRIIKESWLPMSPIFKVLLSSEKFIGRMASAPTTCSNPFCCGNPRRGYKGKKALTLQEQKQISNNDEE